MERSWEERSRCGREEIPMEVQKHIASLSYCVKRAQLGTPRVGVSDAKHGQTHTSVFSLLSSLQYLITLIQLAKDRKLIF